MAPDYFPVPEFPWNENAELQNQDQNQSFQSLFQDNSTRFQTQYQNWNAQSLFQDNTAELQSQYRNQSIQSLFQDNNTGLHNQYGNWNAQSLFQDNRSELQNEYRNQSIQSLFQDNGYYPQEIRNYASYPSPSIVMNPLTNRNYALAPASISHGFGHYILEQMPLSYQLRRLKPLGLNLKITQELVNWMEEKLNAPGIKRQRIGDYSSQPASEKLKPAKIPASRLKIGSWERVAVNEIDMVAKCYFAKKKLVWEILEGGLKKKIEIQWSDIIAINACVGDDEPGVLRIQLNQCPTFYQEKNPEPKKHTAWNPTSDFTGGEASKCRRHEIVFPPGNLNKPYEQLLLSDQRLSQLSRNPFPSLEEHPHSPSHHPDEYFCFDFNQLHYQNPQQQFYPLSSSSPVLPDEQINSNAAVWGEMQPQELNPNTGRFDYNDTSPSPPAAATMGNQNLAAWRCYRSCSVASSSNGHIGSSNSMMDNTEMIGRQFNGSLSEGSPFSGNTSSLTMEIWNILEIGSDVDSAIRYDEMFHNQQQQQVHVPFYNQQQEQQIVIPSYNQNQQQQQQVFALNPSAAAAGMVASCGEMHQQQQQQSMGFWYP